MPKKNSNFFQIFIKAVGLYFSNFNQFMKYMTFPVLGQLLGLLLIFSCTFLYSKQIPFLITKYQFMNNFSVLILCSILITLPGMVFLIKAFWEYLVAYGAINSMTENMLKSGRVYDFDAHTELIKRRTLSFIGLWTLIGLFSFVAICPLFWFPCAVVSVFCVLIFQIFTFEPGLNPIQCIKRSFQLIKGHFASSFALLLLLGTITYLLIPHLINKSLDYLHVTNFLETIVQQFLLQIPFDTIDNFFADYHIKIDLIATLSKVIVLQTIATACIQYTLPLRSITFCLWYKKLSENSEMSITKSKKITRCKKTNSAKTPSENLMQKSHKKFITKKLDRNLLKRAMQKDDEE